MPRPSPRSRTCAAAADASWRLSCSASRRPRRPTCGRRPRPRAGPCRAASRRSPAPRRTWAPRPGGLPADSLAALLDEAGCILVPDPAGPGRAREPRAGGRGPALALGPAGPPAQLAASWSLARAALRAAEAGALPAEGLIRVDEHLGDLLLLRGQRPGRRIAARRLAPEPAHPEGAGAGCGRPPSPTSAIGGNSVAMAAALHVHPQTARYRTARLRELLGDQLDDPDARFELEAALRLPRRRGECQRPRLRGMVLKTASQSGEETPKP